MALAINIDEQIEKLKTRGITIKDDDEAKNILFDIGYYRLRCYFHHFLIDNEEDERRYKEGTELADAVTLYYFDFDLRMLLIRYLIRIETAIRTFIITEMSYKYKECSIWYINHNIVNKKYADSLIEGKYDEIISRNRTQKKADGRKKRKKKYVPAWQMIEYMTLGELLKLYNNIADPIDRMTISKRFGVDSSKKFSSYMEAIRNLRNECAHGGVLYDLSLSQQVTDGPAGKFPQVSKQKLFAAIKVVVFLLSSISENRKRHMIRQLRDVYNNCLTKVDKLSDILKDTIGGDINDIK